ncbi:hypothetical protein [Rhodococcus qingshengii]|uniref:hypothetical protein n=1 Tax=Rhodococcus qingshengii TaxID=334542 RepID=UPI001C8C5EB4|nr:hypothetical protein [Rhodococcus qingshengii]MBX9151970.1 hypothetical protein [Rhodococcus qingshengii]
MHAHAFLRASTRASMRAALKTLDGRAEISDSGATQTNYPALITDAKSPEIYVAVAVADRNQLLTVSSATFACWSSGFTLRTYYKARAAFSRA